MQLVIPRFFPASSEHNNRNLKTWAIGGGVALLFLLLLRWLLLPDPTAKLFSRAQQLEAAGQLTIALRHYEILTNTHPESSYAPRALQHQGDILTSLAQHTRDNNKASQFIGQAVGRYLRLAETYPGSPLAADALLSAGDLAANNLQDMKTARRAYEILLERYPNNADYASEATLRMGRVALSEGQGKNAQTLLQRVLAHYTSFPERCAEALYHLGVTYETLFKKKDWAQNAYQATFAKYPNSIWASTAKERLGMLFYHQTVPGLRRVLVEVTPLPEAGFPNNSLFAALRPLLAARKLEVSDITLRGWSLEPFFAGYVPSNPSRPVRASFDGFNNAVANSGLRYTMMFDKDGTSALQNLQSELDAARPPMVYNGRWTLAVGYDTSRQEVFTQNQGARFDTVPAKEFTATWKQSSPMGGSYTLLAFYLPGERPTFVKPKPVPIGAKGNASPTPGAPAQSPPGKVGGANGQPPAPGALVTPDLAVPTFMYSLKPLSAAAGHRRALRRAAALMQRPQDGNTLLNLAALDALSRDLRQLAIRSVSPIPQPETEDVVVEPEATATPTTARAESSMATPAPTTAPTIKPTPVVNIVLRVRSITGWFKAPLQQWISARRDAAAYLDAAANALREPTLKQAADNFRKASSELELAAASMPGDVNLSSDGTLLTEEARRQLEIASQHVKAARDYEGRAASAMSAVD